MGAKQHTAASRMVLWALLVPLLVSGIFVSLGSLKVLVGVYEMSFVVGLIATITTAPLMFLFAASWLTYYVVAYLVYRDYDENPWEYWGKTVLFVGLATIGCWLVYYFCAWIFIGVATWLAN